MLKTAAWRSLSCNARCIYIEIERHYGGPGSNNGKIHYSIRDAAEACSIGKSTAARALRELQDHGFIVAETVGGFNVKVKRATEWRLTAHASDISAQAATKDFERWQPAEIQNTVPTMGPSVPAVGQYGIRGGTMAA
jgi:hypothetical protein